MGAKIKLVCLILAMMGGAYWWGQRQQPIEANPDPVILSDETATGLVPPPETGTADKYMAEACPEAEEPELLGFADEHTSETLAAATAYARAKDATLANGNTPLIDLVDLNNDGREDFVALSTDECGAAGCLTRVFIQREGGAYDGSGFVHSRKGDIEVTYEMINGMRKIIVTDVSGEKQLWQWSGEEYSRYGHCFQ